VCRESLGSPAPLPIGCGNSSGVVMEGSFYAQYALYVLRGYDHAPLDLIQKLRFDELTWQCMEVRLPSAGYWHPCFKLRDTEVYLVINSTLPSFTLLSLQHL
jgi:hypothetical protein